MIVLSRAYISMVQINVSRSDKIKSIPLTDKSKLIAVVCQNYLEQRLIKLNIPTVFLLNEMCKQNKYP